MRIFKMVAFASLVWTVSVISMYYISRKRCPAIEKLQSQMDEQGNPPLQLDDGLSDRVI